MDNGLAVGYNNIAPGTTTTIQTGMIFTSTLSAELDYTWQNNSNGEYLKHLTVPMNTPVSLRMAANNYNAKDINDVGFSINMPAGKPISGTVTNTGFTSYTPTNGTTSYQVSNGIIPASGSGVILAPVSTAAYGEWTIDETMLGSMSNILPMNGIQPAVLTVTTEANFLFTTPVNITKGRNHIYTVKLPNGVTADRDIVVNLSYSGATTAFNAGPPSVTIPNGKNSATFTVTATAFAPYGSTMNITLSGTNYSPVIIGANNEASIRVGASTPAGTDFWFVAPQLTTVNGGCDHDCPVFLAIFNDTSHPAQVEITLYNGGSPIIIPATIAPGSFYKHDFTTDAAVSTITNPRNKAGNVVSYGTHITSDIPVTAYYMLNSCGSREIWTMKGNNALGTLFYVTMQHDNAAVMSTSYDGSDYVDIVATEDDTEVEITLKGDVRLYNSTGSYTKGLAGSIINITMNKGDTYRLYEYVMNETPTLAGTKITSDKPIAVTVTEDLAAGDGSGDQIVPVSSLGTRYIVPRGYLTNSSHPNSVERFYLIGTHDGTSVEIYSSGSATPDATIALNAGETQRYTFPGNIYSAYVKSTQPVYIYHRSGNIEENASLIPPVSSIGETRVSFFQVDAAAYQQGLFVFRTGTEGSFTISYGSGSSTALNLAGSISNVPNLPEWKVARLGALAAPPTGGRLVTIRNAQSPFSFAYITGRLGQVNSAYGYFSTFGTFEFPDTTWMCGNSVTLEGGYAVDYLWRYPDGVTTATTPSITVTEEGLYTLEMNQDPNIMVATTYVKKVNAGTISAAQQVCTGSAPATLTVSGSSGDKYQWQSSPDGATWTDITGATSPTYSPGVLTVPGYETKSIYYRRGVTSTYCEMIYSNAVEIAVSPCAVIVNPHLRTGVVY
jgi:hypothetical protein